MERSGHVGRSQSRGGADVVPGLRIERRLGRGGSSSVHLATDLRHHRQVAVKIFDRPHVGIGGRDRRPASFERELQAMSRLGDHPYVVDLYDSGFTDRGAPYIVMPVIAGGTVAQRIERRQAFDMDEILDLGVKIGSALDTAHRRGILHCDIKPSNIFLGPYATPLLGDLGIAAMIGDDGRPAAGSALTVAYAAPEVVAEAEHTIRSDVYSLGATLYAMAELAAPFEGSTEELVERITLVTEPPAMRSDLPSAFVALVRSMMDPDPSNRPSSAAEVVARVQRLQLDLTGTQTPSSIEGVDPLDAAIAPFQDGDADRTIDHRRPEVDVLPPAREPSRRLPVVVAAVVVASLAVAAVAYRITRSDDGGVDTAGSAVDTVELSSAQAEPEGDIQAPEDDAVPEDRDVADGGVLEVEAAEAELPPVDCETWYVPSADEEVEVEQTTTALDFSVRRAPDHDAACERGVTLTAGTEVEIHALRADWRYTYDPAADDWGWVHASAFEPDIDCAEWYVPFSSELIDPPEVAVTSTDYGVRRAPDPDPACERGVLMRAGTEVEIHAVRPGWRYTYNPVINDWGWVEESAFTTSVNCSEWLVPEDDDLLAEPMVVATVSDYPVRRAPGHDPVCERGVVLAAGTEIEVRAVLDDWRYTYDPAADDWGWVHASALPPDIDCSQWYLPTDDKYVTIFQAVVETEVIVRRAPDDDEACERGVKVQPGTSLEIHAVQGDWRYTYNPEIDDWGWVHQRVFAADG